MIYLTAAFALSVVVIAFFAAMGVILGLMVAASWLADLARRALRGEKA